MSVSLAQFYRKVLCLGALVLYKLYVKQQKLTTWLLANHLSRQPFSAAPIIANLLLVYYTSSTIICTFIYIYIYDVGVVFCTV